MPARRGAHPPRPAGRSTSTPGQVTVLLRTPGGTVGGLGLLPSVTAPPERHRLVANLVPVITSEVAVAVAGGDVCVGDVVVGRPVPTGGVGR